MFDIDKKTCILDHINIRDEKHGDENVLAIDLKLHGNFDGDILAEFWPELRHSMFKKAEDGDLADQGSDAPTALRFPNLAIPLKFHDEIIGAGVKMAYGIGEIDLEVCDINKFAVTCHEGGTVSVAFRIQAKPTGDQLSKLSQMLGTQVDVSINPPEAPSRLLGSTAGSTEE